MIQSPSKINTSYDSSYPSNTEATKGQAQSQRPSYQGSPEPEHKPRFQ